MPSKKHIPPSHEYDDGFFGEEPDYDHLMYAADDQGIDNESDVYADDNVQSQKEETSKESNCVETEYTEYILGTLLVRLVSARDIPSVRARSSPPPSSPLPGVVGGFVGQFLDASHSFTDRRRRRGPTAPNTFAKMQFLGQTQRTSTIYDKNDPTWPRNEEYYFDVTLPVPVLALEGGEEEMEGLTSTKNKNKNKNKNKTKNRKNGGSLTEVPTPLAPNPTLTIWLMHSDDGEEGSGHRLEISGKRANSTGKKTHLMEPEAQPPILLGVASIDLRPVITGQSRTLDEWIRLTSPGDGDDDSDSNGNFITAGEVRLSCEYEPTDPPPRPGDICRLTGFCCPSDLFPVPLSVGAFLVDNVLPKSDDVILSFTSPEGWICTFAVHRYMVLCAVRHQAALEVYQEQILMVADRLATSPAAKCLTQAVHKLPDEGLVGVGAEVTANGIALLSRWFEGGLGTVVEDFVYATNWDGEQSLRDHDDGTDYAAVRSRSDEEDRDREDEDFIEGKLGSRTDVMGPDEVLQQQPLPGMPACPITGQAMRDPVVASDGHTYERTAIQRWMTRSDKSPLTGALFAHEELVPNYLLISSLSSRSLSDKGAAGDKEEVLSSAKGSVKEERTFLSTLVTDVSHDDTKGRNASLTPAPQPEGNGSITFAQRLSLGAPFPKDSENSNSAVLGQAQLTAMSDDTRVHGEKLDHGYDDDDVVDEITVSFDEMDMDDLDLELDHHEVHSFSKLNFQTDSSESNGVCNEEGMGIEDEAATDEESNYLSAALSPGCIGIDLDCGAQR